MAIFLHVWPHTDATIYRGTSEMATHIHLLAQASVDERVRCCCIDLDKALEM